VVYPCRNYDRKDGKNCVGYGKGFHGVFITRADGEDTGYDYRYE
jgi:hypothetical protein